MKKRERTRKNKSEVKEEKYQLIPQKYKKITTSISSVVILQGGHTQSPETYERMLSITSHQRDAN